MLRSFVLDEKGKVKEVSLKSLKRTKYTQVWIDITSPSKKDFEQILKHIGLHKLTIEDCLTPNAGIKIEQFDHYNFIIIYGIEKVKKKIKPYEVDVIQGKNFVITSHKKKIKYFEKMIENKDVLSPVMKRGSDFLMHSLIDKTVDNFFPVLDSVEEEVDKVERQIFKNKDSGKLLNYLFDIKRYLFTVRKIASTQREVIGLLAKKKFNFISVQAEVYFRDVYDHTIRINDMVDGYREILTSALEVHLSLVSNKMNDVMKVLTIIATIMMPLTLITGLYGMNFKFMPEIYWRYGYPIVIGFMILVAGTMLYYFKKKGWL